MGKAGIGVFGGGGSPMSGALVGGEALGWERLLFERGQKGLVP